MGHKRDNYIHVDITFSTDEAIGRDSPETVIPAK